MLFQFTEIIYNETHVIDVFALSIDFEDSWLASLIKLY